MPLGDAIQDMQLFLVGGSSPEEGEIVLAGPQLAIGYWRDDAATAEHFITLDSEGRRIRAYRTGDVGFRRGGALYFKGRIDRQVKIGGNRVELGEVEAAMRSITRLPAAVILHDQAIHAFLECPELPDVAPLFRKLAESLPRYSIPQRFHAIARLPAGPNDKVDYARLRIFRAANANRAPIRS